MAGVPGKLKVRATNGTGVRLSVETSVNGTLVFAAAVGAHREFGHSGHRPVVGNIEDDAVTWAAIRAIGEGVIVAAVGGIARIRETGIADADVRWDQSEGGLAAATLMDGKARFANSGNLGALNLGNAHQGRRFRRQSRDKGVHRRRVALNLDEHSARRVQHESCQPMAARQVVDVRTKAHTLDDAANL